METNQREVIVLGDTLTLGSSLSARPSSILSLSFLEAEKNVFGLV
jgi:hypothetical protein